MSTYQMRLSNRKAIKRGDPLTAREHDLLRALARGGTLTVDAQAIGITPDYSYWLITTARKKLGATTTAQAVALAAIAGLVELPAP